MTLKALVPVLYRSRQYGAGDTLPATDAHMVEAWIESGAAYWSEVDGQKARPKAKPVSAEPGLGGKSSDGDPAAMVGKVPRTPQRKRK